LIFLTRFSRIRSLLFVVCYIGLLIAMMIICLPILLMPRQVLIVAARIWTRMFRFLCRWIVGINIVVEGQENIPPGGSIIAAKHQSTMEVYIMLTAVRDPAFVLKRSLTYLPFFGWYVWKFKCVPVDRGKGKQALLSMIPPAQEVIRENRQLIIYPEGTRRAPGAQPKYKHGISHLYQQTNAPVVPVALNTGLFWGRNSWQLNPGTAVIRFLPAISPGLDNQNFMDLLIEKIEKDSNELAEEAIRLDPRLGGDLHAVRADIVEN
jgi:1-acyl-sn-glycerol-3-phosphate acyltransferase